MKYLLSILFSVYSLSPLVATRGKDLYKLPESDRWMQVPDTLLRDTMGRALKLRNGFLDQFPDDEIKLPPFVPIDTGYRDTLGGGGVLPWEPIEPDFDGGNGAENVVVYPEPPFPSQIYSNTKLNSNRNFILERNFKVAGVRHNNLARSRTMAEESQRVTYFDNWGRPDQTTDVMASRSYYDIVTPIRYRDDGRKDTDFLPYPNKVHVNGRYASNAFLDQLIFYRESGQNNRIEATTSPYSQVLHDLSPYAKTIEQGAPGNSWQLGAQSVKYEETFNNDLDFERVNDSRKVRRFIVNAQDHSITARPPSGSHYYPPQQIKVSITKNSNWKASDGRLNTVEAYIDKRGNLILNREFALDANGRVQMLSTYYVYSDLGELCYILPPMLKPDEGQISNAAFAAYAYQYTYDKKRRLVYKKTPGIDASYFIYNARDQLVASQNPKQRLKNEWSFTKYDSQGRIIINGVFGASLSWLQLQEQAEKNTITYENRTDLDHGYTNDAWPNANILSYSLLNYYDNYEIPGLPKSLAFSGRDDVPFLAYPTGASTVTKTWTDDLRKAAIWTVNYFDRDAQIIQTKTINYLGGRDQVDNYYNFIGELVSMVRQHTAQNGEHLSIANQYTYNQNGAVQTVKQRINEQEEITLAKYDYNDLGQLVDKKLHQRNGQSIYLQSIDYRYNERGWLRSINDPNLASVSTMNDGDRDSGPDLFGAQFKYEADTEVPQYNGNIAEMQWKTSRIEGQSVSPPQMGYQYRYDKLNRMTAALSERDGLVDNAHSEFLAYDIAGNITNLGRYAFTSNRKQQIDSLVYNHHGYRTVKIDDVSSSEVRHLGFDDKASLPIEYYYDANGNMVRDENKQIDIHYTDLNRPQEIVFGPNHSLTFLYDLTGKKLRATYKKEGAVYTIDYVDGIQYQQGQVAFFHTEEGRARKHGDRFRYEYDIKDHLGNVRVSFIADPDYLSQTRPKVIQQNSYYPFGMLMSGDGAHGLHLSYIDGEKSKFLYTGKELYDQGGLDWYDHGTRMYDPTTGRWMTMDPAAQFGNPYLAMGNNPVIFVDPNGEFIIPVLIGIGVGILGNGITNLIDGESFFNGWVIAGISGGITGVFVAASAVSGSKGGLLGFIFKNGSSAYPSTTGKQALMSAVRTASSYLSVNIPIGSTGFHLGLSPALFMGVGGFGVGANVGLSYVSENFAFGGSFGATAWQQHIFSGDAFNETRFGYSGAVGGKNFKVGFGQSHFKGGGLDQTTGIFNLIGKNWSISYENDYMFNIVGDNGDRWRTTGLAVSVYDVTMKMHFATGDPDAKYGKPGEPHRPFDKSAKGQDYYSAKRGSSPDKYRLGSLAVDYRGTFMGWNSEGIRHIGQNRFAHGVVIPNTPYYKVLDDAPNQGFYYGNRLPNFNTTW